MRWRECGVRVHMESYIYYDTWGGVGSRDRSRRILYLVYTDRPLLKSIHRDGVWVRVFYGDFS